MNAFASVAFAATLVATTITIAPFQPDQDEGKRGADRDAEITRAAEALKSDLVSRRRDFHMHPELSNREERTSRVVADKLRSLGFDEVRTGVARHGVVALLKGGRPGPVVAVRADMDALPINETLDVPYKSVNAGVKHACGHDAHMTIALGVAEILSRMRERIAGSVKFIFQPAEEGPPAGEEGGAPLMIKEGALENPKPAAIFGLHVLPTIEAGQVGWNSGPAMASSDRFVITIRGKKVHAAYPHEGVDSVVVAAECVSALQTIRSRRINATEPLVLSIGIVQGGNRFNIIPDEVRLEGTVRTLNETIRKQVQTLMRETLAGVTSAFGAKYELEYVEGAAVTHNDPELVEATLPTLRRVLGEGNIFSPKPQMGAEDFSYYQKVIPGFYFFLGVGNKTKGITAMIHTPEFDLDEDSLVTGVRTMTSVVLDYLDRNSNR
jgi:amidohydrolase